MKPITAIISTGLALLACVLHFTPLSVWFTAATAFVALGFFGLYTRKLSLVTILGLILLFALSIVNTTRGQQDYFAPAAIVIAALSWRAVLTHRDALAVPVVQSAHLPQQATRIVRGTESSIAVAAIEPGMLLLLREGDVVPVDGLLTEGSCVVNEQALSGLARPIRKFPSSRVHAGSIVTEGRCILRVTEHGEHTLLERLRRRVENSILTPSVTAHRHAKLLRLLTPSLIIFAAVVGVAWAIWNVPAALIVTSAILICASPSLFSLARDTRDSLRFLVQQGVLVQDAQTLEKLTHVDTVVFDKRGILTTGEVRVEHVVSYSPFTQQQVLNIAAAIESKSAHPISKVIVAFARSHGALSLQPVQEFHEEPGRGVRGLLGDKEVLAGSETFLRKRKIKITAEAKEHVSAGKTVVFIVQEKEVIGHIALIDTLRPEARDAMHALKKHARVIVLSGDHEDTTAAVANKAGMHEIIADVLPHQRAEKMKAMKEAGKTVAFVSNGIEDVEARAAADITITMGMRAAVAVESTSITILRPDLSLIPLAFQASHEHATVAHKQRQLAQRYHFVALPLVAIAGVVIAPAALPALAACANAAITIYAAKRLEKK